jgi:hypothetical protein
MMIDQLRGMKKFGVRRVWDTLGFELQQKDVELFEKVGVGFILDDAPREFTGNFFEDDLRDEDAKEGSAAENQGPSRRAPRSDQPLN